MDRIAQAILGLRGAPAYLLVFAVPALEASIFAGFVFPGELAVLLGGVLAFQGRVSLAGAMAAAVGGAVVGDAVGYAVGHRFGDRLFGTRLVRRLVKPRHRERAEALIRRRGAAAVFFGRLSAGLRVLVPGLAGMSGMPFARFLLYNMLGGVVWGVGVTALGYVAGNAWRSAARAASRASVVLGILVVVVGMTVLGARWVIRHEDAIRAWWSRQLERPAVADLRRRYARQIAFARDRVDPRGAFGLYLTLGLAVTLAAAWALGAALQDLVAHEELVLIDRPVERFVRAHQAPMVGDLMRGLAVAGAPWFIAAAALIGAVAAIRRAKSIRPGIYLVGTTIGGFGLERVLHALVGRVGILQRVAQAAGGTFPSEHLVATVAFYGSLAFVVSRLTRSWKIAVSGWAWAAVVVTLVAASRVYVGDRLASGVVAAGALGATWLAVSSTAWLVWDRLGEHPGLRQARNRAVRLTVRWGIVVVSLGVVLHVLLLALPGIRESASTLRHANPALVLAALALEAGSIACLGEVYRRSLVPLGATVPYREAERIAMGMFTVARVVPMGGAAAGVWGARELTALGVEATTAMSSMAIGGAMGMATLGGIVFVGAAASLTRGDISPQYAIAVGLSLAILAAIGVVVWRAGRSEVARERILSGVERGLGRLHVRVDLSAWKEAAGNVARSLSGKGAVRAIVRWSAPNWLLDIAALWLLFFAFGRHVHLGIVVVGYGIANLVAALPLTPGGIGFVEAGLAGTFTAFRIPASVSVVVVLAYRLISFWLPVVAGIPVYLGMGRRPKVAVGTGAESEP